MNNLVQSNVAHLPAHLQHLAQNTALMTLNQSAAAGISAGGWPRISIKAARFRLHNPQQEELVVQQLHLDVIIVDANPHGVSKRFYDKKWNSDQEGEAPVCYSDNGVGPSNRSTKPQCGTCAACPHNVWGSKISEASGKPVRACSDLKKIAVLIAGNTSGPVFELDIPADSMNVFAQFVKSLDKHGIPLPTIVTRLSFDPSVSYPKLMFAPAFTDQGQLPYISEEQMQDVMEVIGTEEVDRCTGKNDTPVDPARVAAAATTVIAAGMQAAPAPQYNPSVTAGQIAPGAAPGLPPVNLPPNAATLPPSSFPVAPPVAAAAGAPVGVAAAGTPSAPPAAKRTRKPKAVDAAQPSMLDQGANVATQAAPAAQLAAPMPTPAFLQNVPQANTAPQAANATAPLVPTGVTNAALDDMIAAAMRV